MPQSPRSVTLEEVKANIKSVRYVNGAHLNRSIHPSSTPVDETASRNLARLTLCILELQNGYICTGENACVDIDNWDEDLALKYSYEDALDKVWAVMGYVKMGAPLPSVQGDSND